MDKYITANSSSTLYTGEVEIKVNKNKTPYKIIKKKNTGTAFFHRYILQCLIDSNLDLNLRPYGIKLYGNSNGTGQSNKLLYKTIFPGVNLTTEPQKGSGETVESIALDDNSISLDPYYIKYHFLIPESFCDGVKTVYKIAMCNSIGNPYAIVNIADGMRLESGSNIDITWTLSIGSLGEENINILENQSRE